MCYWRSILLHNACGTHTCVQQVCIIPYHEICSLLKTRVLTNNTGHCFHFQIIKILIHFVPIENYFEDHCPPEQQHVSGNSFNIFNSTINPLPRCIRRSSCEIHFNVFLDAKKTSNNTSLTLFVYNLDKHKTLKSFKGNSCIDILHEFGTHTANILVYSLLLRSFRVVTDSLSWCRLRCASRHLYSNLAT